MKKLAFLLFLLTTFVSHAQTGPDNSTYNLKDIDEAPAPQGVVFEDYFKKNFHTDEKLTEPLKISFLVEKAGVTHDVKVHGKVSDAIVKETKRVIKSLPKWKPGKKKGQVVRVIYTASIKI